MKLIIEDSNSYDKVIEAIRLPKKHKSDQIKTSTIVQNDSIPDQIKIIDIDGNAYNVLNIGNQSFKKLKYKFFYENYSKIMRTISYDNILEII